LTIRSSVALAALAIALSCNTPAFAQPSGTLAPPSASTDPAVSLFLSNPTLFLSGYPFGGGDLVSAVRHLTSADLSTLEPLLSLAATATGDQKNAIGTGIGLAALSFLPANPQAASIIQSALARLNDPVVLAAYAAVTGNQHLTAAGPGGGGSPGSAETGTGTTTGGGGFASSSALYPNFDTPNVPDTFTIPNITAGTPVTGPTTVGGSVSPSSL
jgi:hypothetical protein